MGARETQRGAPTQELEGEQGDVGEGRRKLGGGRGLWEGVGGIVGGLGNQG